MSLRQQDFSTHHPVAPAKVGWFSRVCRDWVLKFLNEMHRGHLKLTLEDGSQLNLGDPEGTVTAELKVHSPEFYKRIVQYSHIGFAEGYMDGDWETPDLEQVIAWAILNVENSPMLDGSHNQNRLFNILGWLNRLGHRLRPNSLKTSRQNIQEHYDLSNAFFSLFLDPTMTYSSARFTSPEQSLEEAQLEKYSVLCQKLRLKASDHLLEIGTGWGGFSMYAASQYGCRVTTLTISQEQFLLAQERIAAAGLSGQITVLLQDYRKTEGQFDKIASIEMIEAVGDRYFETFFGKCASLLKKDGLLGMQMITCPDGRFELLRDNVDFIQKHIFPGSLLPSLGRVNQALNRTGDLSLFELEDLGLSYVRTLRCWFERFNQNLDAVRALGFDERFIRKWNYYLMYCSAAFRMRNITVVQALYTRPNNLNLTGEEFSG